MAQDPSRSPQGPHFATPPPFQSTNPQKAAPLLTPTVHPKASNTQYMPRKFQRERSLNQ